MQSLSPPPAAAQPNMHADSTAAGAFQPSISDTHALITSAVSRPPALPPLTTDSVTRARAGTLTSADSQRLAEMRSAILAPTLMTSADGHTQPPPPPPPPPPPTVNPATAGANMTAVAHDAHSLVLSAPAPAPAPADTQYTALPSLTDYTLPPMPDMTVAAGPPRVPPRTPALLPYSSMYTVDRALPTMGSSQSSMIDGRCDLSVPLYTTPSVVPTVTSVVPAVHTSSLLSDGVYVSQAPAAHL